MKLKELMPIVGVSENYSIVIMSKEGNDNYVTVDINKPFEEYRKDSRKASDFLDKESDRYVVDSIRTWTDKKKVRSFLVIFVRDPEEWGS